MKGGEELLLPQVQVSSAIVNIHEEILGVLQLMESIKLISTPSSACVFVRHAETKMVRSSVPYKL